MRGSALVTALATLAIAGCDGDRGSDELVRSPPDEEARSCGTVETVRTSCDRAFRVYRRAVPRPGSSTELEPAGDFGGGWACNAEAFDQAKVAVTRDCFRGRQYVRIVQDYYCVGSHGDPEPFDSRSLVGMSLADARRRARAHRCEVRVLRENGEDFPATLDYVSSRINVAVHDGEITRIFSLG